MHGHDHLRLVEPLRPVTEPSSLRALREAVLASEPHAEAARPPSRWLRLATVAGLVGLATLVVWAAIENYALRVTSDTPTFLTLTRDMGEHPLRPESPYLAAPDVSSAHSTPYVQALGLVWRFLGFQGAHPVELARLLTLVGLAVFAFALAAVFAYTDRVAGRRAAWLSVPVLLGLFGPAHVIWASDLSLHGALYASFFPQNLALGLLLVTLLALDSDSYRTLALACALAAATMLVHPFTGVLLSVLACADAVRLAWAGDRRGLRAPVALVSGFALASLWPAYSIDAAFSETGARGVVLVALCATAPLVAWLLPRPCRFVRWLGSARLCQALASERAALWLAWVGALVTAGLLAWEVVLIRHPPAESTRLAIYWVEDRWRWPLLLAAGTVGLVGLVRLARRGRIVPGLWLAGCFAIGTAGAIGLHLPVWYRFLLLCQIPLAIGVATVVAEATSRTVAAVATATFAATIAFKVGTLVLLPPSLTYLGSELQPVWRLGEHVPTAPGLVATDPNTAYYVPAVTGHRVLTVGKGHVGSQRELAAAERGYALLRRYFLGGTDWWQAGQEMWRRGVRYVVVDKASTLEPATLADFTWKSALVVTPSQRKALGNYFYENNKVGDVVYDSESYVVYRLNPKKLFPDGGKE